MKAGIISNFLDFDACIVIDEDLLFSDCFLAVFPERKIANQDHFGCAKKCQIVHNCPQYIGYWLMFSSFTKTRL